MNKPSRLFPLVMLFILGGCSKQGQRAISNDEPSAGRQTTPTVVTRKPKILTKDPEYMQLLNPAQGEALLDSSVEYARKRQEIASKLASIQDPELRQRVSDDEWGKVDKAAYIKEQEETLRTSFPSTMRAVLQRHRADWFEVGHVEYPGTNELRISSVAASPIDLPDGATIPMDVSTIDGVYAKFRQLAQSQIEHEVDAWMAGQSCTVKLKTACENLGGTPAECSSPSALEEVRKALGGLDCNDNPSAKEGRQRAEKQIRDNRLVLVGQGDLIAHRIDKLLLVDYDTETALLEIAPNALTAKFDWKFSSESQAPDLAQPAAPADALNLASPPSRGAETTTEAERFGSMIERSLQQHSQLKVLNSGGAGNQGGSQTGIGNSNADAIGPGDSSKASAYVPNAGANGYGSPTCLSCPQPTFTDEAVAAKVQGTVLFIAIITADGRATDIRVAKALGHGLDQKAVDAVATWRFRPALGPDGHPAAVRQSIEVTFHLSSGGPGMQPGATILTPTEGVDSSSYIKSLLATLKRNWFDVMPESAMAGDKGMVDATVQINRDGSVPPPDPLLERSSGSALLDNAALSAIRASNSFEPLPSEFKGPYIRVRIVFLYNLPLEYAK